MIAVSVPSGTPGTVTFTSTSVTYIPALDTHGDFGFQYTIRDAAGMTSTAMVVVHAVDVSLRRWLLDVRVRFGPVPYLIKDVARDLPWININQLDLVFSEGVDLTAANLKLTGKGSKDYMAGVTLNHAPGAVNASLSLPTAIGVDRLMLLLDGDDASIDGGLGVRDTSGNFLSGGDYRQDFDVLPGDFNGDGIVNSTDVVLVRNQLPGYLPAGSTPSIFADVNGDGVVDLSDYNLVRSRSGTKLPCQGRTHSHVYARRHPSGCRPALGNSDIPKSFPDISALIAIVAPAPLLFATAEQVVTATKRDDAPNTVEEIQ